MRLLYRWFYRTIRKVQGTKFIADVLLEQDSISAGKIPPIRALVLNAGFQDFGKQSWTKDGLDTTFVANYLGHWLLTLLLLKSIDRETGRIIIIGSQAHE